MVVCVCVCVRVCVRVCEGVGWVCARLCIFCSFDDLGQCNLSGSRGLKG